MRIIPESYHNDSGNKSHSVHTNTIDPLWIYRILTHRDSARVEGGDTGKGTQQSCVSPLRERSVRTSVLLHAAGIRIRTELTWKKGTRASCQMSGEQNSGKQAEKEIIRIVEN